MATKKRNARTVDDLRPEYDLASLSGRMQGKYYERARSGTNLVVLEPEIAEAFPDSKAVNEALGLLLRVARTGRLRLQAHQRQAGEVFSVATQRRAQELTRARTISAHTSASVILRDIAMANSRKPAQYRDNASRSARS
jgi:hypothetical protein